MGKARRRLPLIWLCTSLFLGAASVRADEPGQPASPAAATPATTPTTTADAPRELPPEGWWVPATLKLPKAAEGRIAWRFTLREIITIDRDNKLERRPADLKLIRPHTFRTELPVPILIEFDDKQHILTVTVLKPKAAFFTLNPAGDEDVSRFDKLVINVHADSAEVTAECDKAVRCTRLTDRLDLTPTEAARTLTGCRDVMLAIRQDLAARHRPIPTVCR